MIESLYSLDLWLFYLVNHGTANPVFDVVMPFITNVDRFIVIYVIALGLLLWKGGSRGRWCVLLMLLTVAIADPLNSRIVKEAVGRVRPCSALPDVRLLVPCGAGKSFPSSHAVNNIAAAVIVGFFYRRVWLYFLGYAVLVAFSRVYVGVHYPADVLGGGVEGGIIALILILLWSLIYVRFTGVRPFPQYVLPEKGLKDGGEVQPRK
jgi:membrane-associated phospholipid phosphatase